LRSFVLLNKASIKITEMRKLKVQMQMTLDGFAAGLNNEMDWVFASGPDAAGIEKITELAADSDTVLIGAGSAQEFVSHWQNVADNQPENPWHAFAKLMDDHRKIVFSRSNKSFDNINVEVENGDLATAVQALKQQNGKDIIVYGGIDFVSALISFNLVDEYYFFNCPAVIGEGRSIFKEKKLLKLESSTAYKNGKVLNKYVQA